MQSSNQSVTWKNYGGYVNINFHNHNNLKIKFFNVKASVPSQITRAGFPRMAL